MKNLFHTWLNNLNRPSPDTLDHGPDVAKEYDYPDTIDSGTIRKYIDHLLNEAENADRYVNDPENWWNREEIQWQAGYRDAVLDAVESLRHLIDGDTPPLDMTLVEELFPKPAAS